MRNRRQAGSQYHLHSRRMTKKRCAATLFAWPEHFGGDEPAQKADQYRLKLVLGYVRTIPELDLLQKYLGVCPHWRKQLEPRQRQAQTSLRCGRHNTPISKTVQLLRKCVKRIPCHSRDHLPKNSS